MHDIHIGWMYPNLLNLHGERGSVQALVHAGHKMGLDVHIHRIEDFDDPIPFDTLDLLIFLPGEITSFQRIIPALRSQARGLNAYLEGNGYLLALGTSGLMFGKSITREDDSTIDCLGYLDMVAKERKYVWGDDLHLRINGSKQELAGSQIMMADVTVKHPFGTVLYGRGNNGSSSEGARWKNLIYTNCLGPLFVKNPWFAEDILKNICLKKFLGIDCVVGYPIQSDSFHSTLQFIQTKTHQ